MPVLMNGTAQLHAVKHGGNPPIGCRDRNSGKKIAVPPKIPTLSLIVTLALTTSATLVNLLHLCSGSPPRNGNINNVSKLNWRGKVRPIVARTEGDFVRGACRSETVYERTDSRCDKLTILYIYLQ